MNARKSIMAFLQDQSSDEIEVSVCPSQIVVYNCPISMEIFPICFCFFALVTSFPSKTPCSHDLHIV